VRGKVRINLYTMGVSLIQISSKSEEIVSLKDACAMDNGNFLLLREDI